MLNNEDRRCILIDQEVTLVMEKAGTVGGLRIPRTIRIGQSAQAIASHWVSQLSFLENGSQRQRLLGIAGKQKPSDNLTTWRGLQTSAREWWKQGSRQEAQTTLPEVHCPVEELHRTHRGGIGRGRGIGIPF